MSPPPSPPTLEPVPSRLRGTQRTPSALMGVGLSGLAYGLFSIQDATVKWLVTDFSVFEVLFVRSLVALVIAWAVGGRDATRTLRTSPNKVALAIRAGLILLAWSLFYAAAKRMGLAELTTIYFVAPVVTVLLSVVILHEHVHAGRWVATLIGLLGVAIAARPGGGVPLGPALLTLAAAACWASSSVMVRLISRSETTTNQMIVSNGLFTLACGATLAWTWRTPDLSSLGLMTMLGVAGGCGQFLLFEGFRYAPASLIAPTEYSAFVWAFLLGYLIWGDVPSLQVWCGAGLILASGVVLLWSERRRRTPDLPTTAAV